MVAKMTSLSCCAWQKPVAEFDCATDCVNVLHLRPFPVGEGSWRTYKKSDSHNVLPAINFRAPRLFGDVSHGQTPPSLKWRGALPTVWLNICLDTEVDLTHIKSSTPVVI